MKLICIGRTQHKLFLMNIIEQIKVNDTSIDGYQGTYYSENPEWIKMITDSEDKVLEGI